MMTQPDEIETASLGSLISTISQLLCRGGVTAGDVAALRRMDPRHPAAAFFKIEGLVLDSYLPGDAAKRMDRETRWAAIIGGLANLGTLHESGRRLGDVLADAQYSELRFARLVRADSERLVDELPALARFLTAKGAAVDWTGASELILSADGSREESVRRHLARDYYRSVARQESH
jgi:CRISPR system Cascade subunit CasB